MRQLSEAPTQGQPPPRSSFFGISALANSINSLIYYAVAGLLFGMFICAFLQVIVRLVFDWFGINLPMPWSEELSRFFMIWLIFLGAGYACRGAQLISLTLVVDRMPKSIHRAADGIAAAICIAFYALLVKVGLDAMRFGWIETSPVLQLPKAYVYLAMPVGAAVMIINTLAFLAERGMFGWTYQRSSPAGDAAPGGSDQ